ncbi:histamine N-methyltransferase-like [Antennarius striatus]|uniref:histamine N-methyltransferase-like n=1 Tax=Antennarius striatus TaxID=241820 RepID=UPI0035B0FD62
MASPLKRLITESDRYTESFKRYKECSVGYQGMQKFMENLVPDLFASIVNGKSQLNVIGVGSGTGDIDLQMFSVLHQKYPHVTVDSEVVEPDSQTLRIYRDLVSETPSLDYIQFHWNEMTLEEFQKQWKEKKINKKVDLIHMFQVLYFAVDLESTISFYQSLLNKNGKLLITLLSCDSGSVRMREAYKNQLCPGETNLSTGNIKNLLDSKGVSYQSYILPSDLDITDIFTEGDENGEMLLDFLTNSYHFGKTASPDLKAGVMEFLRRPDCSVESDGKVNFKNNFELLVLDQLI